MLAVKIRNVKIKAVNDAKEIVVIVYFSTIAIVESFLLGLVLQDYNNVSEALSLGHVLLAASAAVGLIFIPKVQIQFISIHAQKTCTYVPDDISVERSTWRESVHQ